MITVVLVLIFSIVIWLFIFSSTKTGKKLNAWLRHTNRFYDLEQGNQYEVVIGASQSHDWLIQIKTKYNWDIFDEYDNRMWEYMYELFDAVVDEGDYNDYDTLWNNLNRPQKVFWSFLVFNGEVNDGGVYQFIWQRPRFIFSVLQMWQQIGMDDIADDYKAVLQGFSKKGLFYQQVITKFNNPIFLLYVRFRALILSFKEPDGIEIIEQYYYNEDFKQRCYQSVADYVEKNFEYFIQENRTRDNLETQL